MIQSLRNMMFAVSLAVLTLNAQATVLTFENIDPSPASFDVMPSPYSGFTFSGWLYGPDTLYTPASGSIDLFTDYADPNDPTAFVITVNNSISRATSFYFDGAWFSGYSGVTFELYSGGALVHTSGTIADAAGPDPYLPTFLGSGYAGLIDTVKVSGVQGYYSLDDFTYRNASTSNDVAEPNMFALIFLGLAVGGMVRRRETA